MNRIVIIILFLISFSAFAQQADSAKKQIGLIFKVDVLMPVYSLMNTDHYKIFSFTAEKLFSKRHSLQLTILSLTQNYKSTNESNYPLIYTHTDNFSSIAIIPEYKFFASKKKNCTGYYVGVFAQYLYDTEKYTNNTFVPAGFFYYSMGGVNVVGPTTISNSDQLVYQRLAIGLMNGIQYYLFKHLVIDCLIGIGPVGTISQNGSSISTNNKIGQLIPRAAINLGYKF